LSAEESAAGFASIPGIAISAAFKLCVNVMVKAAAIEPIAIIDFVMNTPLGV
jgi:hypothetical protein